MARRRAQSLLPAAGRRGPVRADRVRPRRRAVDLRIETDPETLVGFLAGAPVTVQAEGDRELLERLPEIFAFAA
jgi:hypothetical protein